MEIKRMYMIISVDRMPEGLNLFISISPDNIAAGMRKMYPHGYIHVGAPCTWHVYSNEPLSTVTLKMAQEYADRACEETTRVNDRRKVANRK